MCFTEWKIKRDVLSSAEVFTENFGVKQHLGCFSPVLCFIVHGPDGMLRGCSANNEARVMRKVGEGYTLHMSELGGRQPQHNLTSK